MKLQGSLLASTLVFQNPVRGDMFIECSSVHDFLFVFQRGFGRNGTKSRGSIYRSGARRTYRCRRAEKQKELMRRLLVSIDMSLLTELEPPLRSKMHARSSDDGALRCTHT